MTVDEKMIAFANRLADASGAVIRPYFRQRIDVTHKPGVHAYDPVTEADRGAERAIRAIIDRDRPQDAILGEEYGEKPVGLSANKWRWVLDPVDGTRGFITGRHEWGSLIALERYMEATGAWSQAAQLAPSDPEVRGALATLEDVARRSRAHDAARDAAAAADSAGSDGSSRMTDR